MRKIQLSRYSEAQFKHPDCKKYHIGLFIHGQLARLEIALNMVNMMGALSNVCKAIGNNIGRTSHKHSQREI